ncbi:alpha/beta hydrolase [bacterium]|nr:MAG: alpha/beta hydrolase [bacterium]
MKTTLSTVVSVLLSLGAFVPVASAQPKNSPKLAPPPAPPKGTKIYRNLAYVPKGHVRQKLDLYVPAALSGSPTYLRPLIVYIHGGAFMYGDKNSSFLPTRMLSRGYALASLNYRLSGDARFPAQIQDCKAAVRWLRAHAKQYGLDSTRIVAWGESAGGNLAALLGTTGRTKSLDVGANRGYSSAVQGVVDYYGPTDFLQMDAYRRPGTAMHDPANSPESRLIGGPIQQNKAKVARANPITYISSMTPPFFIAHGGDDRIVPYSQSTLLYVALGKAQVKAAFHPVIGADHGFKGATATQKRRLEAATDGFLREVFSGRG